MSVNFEKLLKIMDEVRGLIDSPNTDLTWSRYRTVEEALTELYSIVEKVKRNELSVIQDLKILFAPTGAYQEISINSVGKKVYWNF
jgi:hypothetical protein